MTVVTFFEEITFIVSLLVCLFLTRRTLNFKKCPIIADAIKLGCLSLPSCPSHKGKEEQVEERNALAMVGCTSWLHLQLQTQ